MSFWTRLELAVLLDERLEIRKALRRLAVLGRVGLDLGRPEARHQVLVLRFNRAELVEHQYLRRLSRPLRTAVPTTAGIIRPTPAAETPPHPRRARRPPSGRTPR